MDSAAVLAVGDESAACGLGVGSGRRHGWEHDGGRERMQGVELFGRLKGTEKMRGLADSERCRWRGVCSWGQVCWCPGHRSSLDMLVHLVVLDCGASTVGTGGFQAG